MAGLTQLLNTGVSGITAATEAMQTVSNNTANINTPGYNVQSVNQAQLPGVGGSPGNGAYVTSIQRGFDQFIYQEMVRAGSVHQAAQLTQSNAQNLTAIFPVASGGTNGLGAAFSDFFAALNQVAQDPANLPARQVMLGNAQSLAANFNSIGAQLSGNLTNLNGQMTSAVQQINALTTQIATLNRAITAQAGALAGAPNSLLDTRDNLVQQLGQQVGLTLIPGANGALDVYTSGGAALVNGGTALQLGVAEGKYRDGGIAVTYAPTGQELTDSFTGGALGGLLASRAQFIHARDSVGAMANALAAAVNTQQSHGLDLDGNLGGPLFSAVGPTVYAAQSNTGTGSLGATITDMTGFVPGDFLLLKTATGFEATNLATGEVTALGSGPTLSLDGMTITVAGIAATGDTFKLAPTEAAAEGFRIAATDPASIAAASPYVVTPGTNIGNVVASVGGAVAAGTLAPGTPTVPATEFGEDLSIRFTSSTAFEVLSSANAVIASGSFSPATGAQIAIAYPAPAAAGEVVTVSLSPGTPAAGDRFELTPGGVGGNGNIVAMAGLATQALISGQTLANAYAALVARIGSDGQAAEVAAQSAQGVLARATAVQQSVSGVNLDEQAANLVNYQQAYQAAATVIATAQTLFDSLLFAARAG